MSLAHTAVANATPALVIGAEALAPANDRPWMRPSVLPKLSLCGHYRPDAVGFAANRGTLLDGWFRDAIQGIESGPFLAHDNPEDIAAVEWSVDTARAIAGGAALEAREEHLKADCGIAPLPPGTADLLCVENLWSADLKTGQVRDYQAQQACYALGFMDLYFAEEWTVYLLYCDQRKLERLHFTRDGAETIIRDALALYLGGVPPEPNDYCGWCSARWTCHARRENLALVLPVSDVEPFLEAMVSEKLRDFVLAAAVVEDYGVKARELLKERRVSGEKIQGVSLTSKCGARKLDAVELMPLVEAGAGPLVLDAFPSINEAKALELWGDFSGFPADKVIEAPGSSYVTVRKPKKAKAE